MKLKVSSQKVIPMKKINRFKKVIKLSEIDVLKTWLWRRKIYSAFKCQQNNHNISVYGFIKNNWFTFLYLLMFLIFPITDYYFGKFFKKTRSGFLTNLLPKITYILCFEGVCCNKKTLSNLLGVNFQFCFCFVIFKFVAL